MAVFNPYYNEETGWAAMDTLEPWQQALANPGARNPGMSMPGYDQNLINQINGQGSVSNPGAGTGGGMMTSDPYTWTGGTSPRPSQTTPTIASPSLLANSMGMTGAENVGGMGMYTGSNGPLDLNRFTPVNNQQASGPPQGSIPTGDPNTWITPWGATYNTPGSVNNQTSADYDAWRQRTYGNMMGPQGQGPNTNPYSELTDALVRQPGSISAQTFQGYLNNLQQQQTGPYPPQQTAPRPPQNQQPTQPGDPVARSMRADPYRNFESNSPGQPGYNPNYGQQGGYAAQRTGQQAATIGSHWLMEPGTGRPVGGSPGMLGRPSQYQQDMQAWQQRDPQWFAANSGVFMQPGQMQVDPAMGQMPQQGPSQYDPVNDPEAQGRAYWASRGFPNGNPSAQIQIDANYPSGNVQSSWQQRAQQFSSDPAQQQAYLRDMMGGNSGWNPQPASNQQVDFRAATFGGSSLFPASTGGSGNSNIPNTTNPSTNQYTQPSAGWGNTTNRRSGFGGMSLFGNVMGGGNMGGQSYGQPASQYRGAGSYGRPASFGQSQRPNF